MEGRAESARTCAMSRMSETHELAVGILPAPWPTKTDLCMLVDRICTALVAPLMEASVLSVGTKHGDTKAEMRPEATSLLATPSSLTVPPRSLAYSKSVPVTWKGGTGVCGSGADTAGSRGATHQRFDQDMGEGGIHVCFCLPWLCVYAYVLCKGWARRARGVRVRVVYQG